MDEEHKRGFTIFLEFLALIGLLAGFNLYTYFRGGSRWFLVVGIIAAVIFVGWAGFYFFYVRRPERHSAGIGQSSGAPAESQARGDHGVDQKSEG